MDKEFARRKFLYLTLMSLGGTAVSCASPSSKTPEPVPFPQVKPTPSPKRASTFTPEPTATTVQVIKGPSLTPVIKEIPTSSPTSTTVVRIEPTSTLTVGEKHDLEIKHRLEQAQKDEIVRLDDVLVEKVLRFPWEGGQAYIATLDTLNPNEKPEIAAVLLSADCLYETFRRENELGSAIFLGGAWKPEKRVDHLTAEVSAPSAIGVPVPILNTKSVTYKSLTQSCKEETALERLKEAAAKIKWGEIPEDTGQFIGWFTREFLEGLKRGLQNPIQD